MLFKHPLMHKTGHTTKNYLVRNISSTERTSPVVQWLTFWGFRAGGPGSIPGQGTRSYISEVKKK